MPPSTHPDKEGTATRRRAAQLLAAERTERELIARFRQAETREARLTVAAALAQVRREGQR